MSNERPAITEEWLRRVGFKWHQLDRQPDKNWLLWLGDAIGERDRTTSYEDLGIELAPRRDGEWFCWLRADISHRYSRFLHVRHLRFRDEVEQLVAALTGQPWDNTNHLYGCVHSPKRAAALRAEHERLDKRLAEQGHPWSDAERDGERGIVREHLQAAIDGGRAK